MSGSFAPSTPGARTVTLTAKYRRLRQLGFDDRAAANLTAVWMGIPVGRVPWKVRELTHLAFLNELARRGAAWSGPDDVAPPNGDVANEDPAADDQKVEVRRRAPGT
jgi:hypothetical protein